MSDQTQPLITPALVAEILEGYRLPAWGLHGLSHWARVLENGRRLASLTGADRAVLELFAVFHDSRRRNEGWDPGHGLRGGQLASQLRGRFFDLDDERLALLQAACDGHTGGRTAAQLTVQACWDSDRLDLARAGFRIDPRRLCTAAARQPETLDWAGPRGRARIIPDLVRTEWNLSVESGECVSDL